MSVSLRTTEWLTRVLGEEASPPDLGMAPVDRGPIKYGASDARLYGGARWILSEDATAFDIKRVSDASREPQPAHAPITRAAPGERKITLEDE